MSQHTENPSFRYSNDNRDLADSVFIAYPSQQTITPTSTKGQRNFYSNDNGGYYANSNRSSLSKVDSDSNIQYPNQNKAEELILALEVIAGNFIIEAEGDTSNLNIGDTIILSEGQPNEEEAIISDFPTATSIELEGAVQFTHTAGTPIVKKIITDQIDNEWLTESGEKLITQAGDSFVWNL